MSSRYAPISAAGHDEAAASAANTRLGGRRLTLVRAVWIALAMLVVGLFVASLPADFAAKRPVFDAPDVVARVSQLGLSVTSYALIYYTLTLAFAFCYCALGVLIFRRRPDDWMALFVALLLVLVGTQFPSTTLTLARSA